MENEQFGNEECEENVYNDEWVDQGVENDEISGAEAGFMQGFIESYIED